MIEPAKALRAQTQSSWTSQSQASVHAGVSPGTITRILQNDHIPQIGTLFRPGDHFGADRVEILYLAATFRLPTSSKPRTASAAGTPGLS